MKRFLIAICVLCLLVSLVGCGNQRGGTFEDVTYPFTWTEQQDGSVLLRFTQPAPDGYQWQTGPGGVVQVEDSRTEEDGTVSFRMIPLINGEDGIDFKLVSSDGVAYVLYTLRVIFLVDDQGVLSVTDCYEVTGEQLSTVGEDEDYPVNYVWTVEGLQLTVEEGDWTYTHENDWFKISEDIEGGYFKLLVFRQSSEDFYSLYMNDTFTGTDITAPTAEAVADTPAEAITDETGETTAETEITAADNPSTPEMDAAVEAAGQRLQEYAAEKDDVLYLHSYKASVTYRFYLHMAADGKITVTKFTSGEYMGEIPDYAGMQLHYDPVTGETRATFSETDETGTDIGTEENVLVTHSYDSEDASNYPAYSGVSKKYE